MLGAALLDKLSSRILDVSINWYRFGIYGVETLKLACLALNSC